MKLVDKLFLKIYVVFSSMVLIYIVSTPLAEALQSNNFQFVEPSLGGVGLLDTQSANYRASGSGAVLGIGNQVGTAYQLNAGHLTTPDPTLSFTITDSTADFGAFSPATATTSTTTFEVINYTSYGYLVLVSGTPPTSTGSSIDAMGTSSPEPSQVGIEQFGINLVANTSPSSFGTNPDNGSFGFGQAATNYNTANNYRFVSGETIALAPKTSGKTVYTISYLINVGALTPGGQYTSNQTIIVIGTY